MFNNNLFIFQLLLIIYYLLLIESASNINQIDQLFDSPCPELFSYSYDQNGLLHGRIEFYPPPNDNIVRLNVELSVGNNVENYNGNIELAYPKPKIIDDILHRRPIRYRVFFPFWSDVPPKITKIQVNGDIVCTGPKLQIGGLISILTTINLQHTLTINGISLSSKKMTNQPINTDLTTTTTTKDPTKIYGKNPFLNTFLQTTTTTTPKPSPPPTQPSTTTLKPYLSINPFLNGRLPESSTTTTIKTTTIQPPPFAEICGFPIITTPLIVHGHTVPRGAYPWLAALFEVKNTGLTYRCVGTLYSRRHIVTAAHCVKIRHRKVRPEELLLVLGKLNIKKWTAADGERNVDAETIHVHPEYEAMSAHADIAVIVLTENLEFDKFIRPICLWSGGEDLKNVIGAMGTVVGWGRDENGEIMTATAKETRLPIVSQEQCLRSSDTYRYITSEKTFCAGYRNGSGPCNGDSGSGFVMKSSNNRWTLRGIVSIALSDVENRTCDLSNYVVFTDASKYVDWLLSFI